MLNESIQHISKATNLISQAVGAARVASLNLRSRREARRHLYTALEELRLAQEALPTPRG
jgi:hypothetical protein